MFGVNPRYRGKGIGKALLAAALSYLKDRGAEEVELTSDKENQAACSLYESFGFKALGEYSWFEKILSNEKQSKNLK
jgi:ribosomal protein S18 acetylase RimI-like enzyme